MTCLVYLDDIIIFGKRFEEQLARLREVFSRISSANLKLKPTKFSLFRRSVSFLGHIVSEQGISMQTEKIQATQDWVPCETITELRAYLGTCGYYRRFVKDFSTIAAPLYALTKKKAKTNGHPSANEHLKLSSSCSCLSLFLLYPLTKEPNTRLLATKASEPYCPKSSPELRE